MGDSEAQPSTGNGGSLATSRTERLVEPTGNPAPLPEQCQPMVKDEASNSDRDFRPDIPPPLSKSQQKKLKRKQEWEEGREDRKKRRRERLKAARARKREAIEADPSSALQSRQSSYVRHVTVPVTIVVDCAFDALMNENELISLGTQLTRSYADTKKAQLQANLCISGWTGRLKERFDGLMEGAYKNWKGVKFRDGELASVIEEAQGWMKEQASSKGEGALGPSFDGKGGPEDPERGAEQGEVVYLSSDSPDTLERLKPFGTYIIGGLVDKNRHKGVCYKRAMDAGIKTAKLPIGEHIKMSSRQVLATCHVNEIMHKWLELGDWGAAFTAVIPKRKGGVLRNSGPEHETSLEDPRGAGGNTRDHTKGGVDDPDIAEDQGAAV